MAMTTIHRQQHMRGGVRRGIALLITIIFMAVMLAFGVALAALGYKQSVLASTAVESQDAFYVADAVFECELYADQRQGAFNYFIHSAANLPDPGAVAHDCDGSVYSVTTNTYDSTRYLLVERISIDNGGSRCADVTIAKYKDPLPNGNTSYIFSTGYSVSCSTLANPAQGARYAARGIETGY